MTMNFATNKVDIALLGEHVRLDALSDKIGKTYFAKRYADALSINTPKGLVFVFDYGVIISWGISDTKKTQLSDMLTAFIKLPNTTAPAQHFVFDITENASLSIIDEHLVLPDCKTMTLLSVSHALAQSAKLRKFELQAERSIKDHAYLPLTLAETGKIPLSRKKISRLRGALFASKSDIVLHFNLLDTPRFFAEYPEQAQKYLTLSRYLDLKPRVELLTMKLGSITELNDMLGVEQNLKHASFLEWIIIMLIALQIVLFFVH